MSDFSVAVFHSVSFLKLNPMVNGFEIEIIPRDTFLVGRFAASVLKIFSTSWCWHMRNITTRVIALYLLALEAGGWATTDMILALLSACRRTSWY
jgi:hypothetical protein